MKALNIPLTVNKLAMDALRSHLHLIPLFLSGVYILTLFGWWLFPALFSPYSPLQPHIPQKFLPPSGSWWFGTDQLGRDVFSRIIYGTQNSLLATLIAVISGLLAGCVIGLVSGFGPPRLDRIIMRFIDVLLSIPRLLLSLAIVTALGFGLTQVALAVGVSSIGSFARIMRSEVIKIKNLTFVESSLLLGASRSRVAIRHVLPHSSGPIVALSALEFGSAILSVSSLSFLGFGAAPPEVEWGLVVAEGRNYINECWWLILFPSIFIVLSVITANVIGRFLGARYGND